jgi:hypothetical protein
MKVLFHSIGKQRKIERADDNHKWEWKTDYQLDSLFHGLASVLGDDLIDTPEFDHMYKENLHLLHADNPRRFSLFGKVDAREVDRNDIPQKVKSKYFDFVILGLHHADEVSDKELEEIELFKDSNLVIIHGGDNLSCREELLNYGPIFKRELNDVPNDNFHPISFSIPSELIVDEVPEKSQAFGTVIPSFMQQPSFSTYIFDNEKDYLKDYGKSFFGLTWRKGGWDCLRHYEIMAAGCVPYFVDLQQCPPHTLKWLPKDLLLQVLSMKHVDFRNLHIDMEKFDFDLYNTTANRCLNHTKKHLTTETMAKYVLETISKIYT